MRRSFIPKRAVFLAPALIACLPVLVAAQGEVRKLSLEMYLDLESVTDPRLSSDGRQVVYTRQWFDKMNDRRESSLWIVNRDGGRNRFLIDGSSPRAESA